MLGCMEKSKPVVHGFIKRDELGLVVAAFCIKSWPFFVGVQLAVEVGLQPVVIVSQDSTNVVNLLLPRNANKAANSLAKAALSVDEELFLPKDTHPCTEDIYPPLFVLMFPGFGY
ncbi:hypothetical protein ACOSQ2_012330 [Xanthoceras sorbifolium]